MGSGWSDYDCTKNGVTNVKSEIDVDRKTIELVNKTWEPNSVLIDSNNNILSTCIYKEYHDF